MLVTGGNILQMTTDAAAVTGSSIEVGKINEVLSSEATGEEKVSFLIGYFMDKRSALLDYAGRLAMTLIVALIVYVIGRKLVKICLRMTSNWMKKREVEVSVQKFVMSFANVVYHLLLIMVIASILGIGTSSIIAMVGSAGLAIGLALQGSLANLAGGVLILGLKTFKVGDYIITSGAEGTVESIDIFYTRLSTTDNKVIVIPNGTISNSNVTNTSKEHERMLILEFMVGYDTDIDQVRSLLLEQMQQENKICQDQPMSVVIDKLNPGRIKMQAKAWSKTKDYWEVRYRMLEKIKTTLQNNNISLL